jgi:hypothetical protein
MPFMPSSLSMRGLQARSDQPQPLTEERNHDRLTDANIASTIGQTSLSICKHTSDELTLATEPQGLHGALRPDCFIRCLCQYYEAVSCQAHINLLQETY